MVDGIRKLMDSDLEGAANIGLAEYVSVKDLVDAVAEVAKKRVKSKYVSGPVGVQSRNFSNERIYSTGWKPQFSLRDGIQRTYPWIEAVVRMRRSAAPKANALPGEQVRHA
jgi:nucleoside-diphosphate-sugar epimerase